MLKDLTFNAFFPNSYAYYTSFLDSVKSTLMTVRLVKCDLHSALLTGIRDVPTLGLNITHLSCELKHSFSGFPLDTFQLLECWTIFVTDSSVQASYRGSLPKLTLLNIKVTAVFGFDYWEKYMAVRLAPLIDFGRKSPLLTPSLQELRFSLGVVVDSVPPQRRVTDLTQQCQKIFQEAEGGKILLSLTIG
jgi:hypothetical protein